MEHRVLDEGRSWLREWHRDWPERRIAGVCAGLAAQLELPLTLVRAAFVLGAVIPAFSGSVIVLYLALWFLMPAHADAPSGLDRVVEAVESLTRGRDDSLESDEERH